MNSVGTEDKESKLHTVPRERFSSRWDAVLYCSGLAVGVSAIWRFPFLVYQNGGGAFVLAFLVLLIVVGFPLYVLDVSLGQFSSQGPSGVWRCVPLAKGIGYAHAAISFAIAIYYNVLLAYVLYYLVESSRSVLPWEDCHEWSGADAAQCFVRQKDIFHCKKVTSLLHDKYASTNLTGETLELFDGAKAVTFHAPVAEYDALMSNCSNASMSAAEMFWERHVLQLSSGISEVGGLKWDLVACLFVSWVIVYLCIVRGVSVSGKVVYFTATFPFVVITIFLVKGLTLDGAMQGVEYYLIPKFENLKSIVLWRKAAEQMCFALSVGYGNLIMSGSHQNFHTRTIITDSLIVIFSVFMAAFMGGLAIFSILGYMSKTYGVPVEEVAKQGQGLAFVVFPEVVTTFWCPQLWSVTFFLMLFLLGIDSEFPLIQTTLTVLTDDFPSLRRHRATTALGLCVICFLLGLTCVTRGGQYVLNLMDTYCAGVSILTALFLEIIAVMWIYGVGNFSNDVEFMLGSRPNFFTRLSWLLISPLICAFLVGYYFYDWTPIVYNNKEPYPRWADYLGFALAAFPLIPIPVIALLVVLRKKSIMRASQPEDTWGPADTRLLEGYKDFKDSRASRS